VPKSKDYKMSVLSKFYDYQLDAFEAIQEADRGIVLMPTGTGKTFVQAGVIANDIVENPGHRVYVVNAPRIMLSFQLMREVQKFLLEYDLDARYLAVHSGRVEDDEEISKLEYLKDVEHVPIESTTSGTVIKDTVKQAKKDKKPIVIFSTYHSAERIGKVKIDIALNDEAHFLTEDRFFPIIKTLKYQRIYFFTATARVADVAADYNGTLMNNAEAYGDTLYKMTPREAIDLGKMVRPRLHFIADSTQAVLTDEEVKQDVDKLVSVAFCSFGQWTKASSCKRMDVLLVWTLTTVLHL
jgi:predicted helicase